MRGVGIDIGGTFTDILTIDEDAGDVTIVKVPSTHDNPTNGVMAGLEEANVSISDVDRLVHGTTIALNTLLERDAADVGLITTKGFKGILDLRRRDRPDNYGLTGAYDPLVPRRLRFEVDERTDATGTVLTEVDTNEVRHAALQLIDLGVEAVAISFLHSYANAENEGCAVETVQEVWPNEFVTASSDLLPEIYEFERTSTAVANAYVQPRIDGYLQTLFDKLVDAGYQHTFRIMQSNGGAVTPHAVVPANTLFSGPAAGAIGAEVISRDSGYTDVLSVDMGGTSFDATLITTNGVEMTTEKSVEFGIPIRLPMVDVQSIGAGGGSIAWVDAGNVLKVGPQSAGADPGPICYANGGERPTVTDAHVILNRLDPSIFTDAPIESAVARGIDEWIGEPLGLDTIDAAEAILNLANNHMGGLLRLMTVEEGLDPRSFALTAFGGAGPMHAVELARELSIDRVIIPPFPGVLSAYGLLVANSRIDDVRTLNIHLDDLDGTEFDTIFTSMAERSHREMNTHGVSFEGIDSTFQLDVHYEGQSHIVTCGLPTSRESRDTIESIFESEYERRYHHTTDMPIVVRNARCVTIGRVDRPQVTELMQSNHGDLIDALLDRRTVYFSGEVYETPIYDRFSLPALDRVSGPAIVEGPDATVVIPPGASGRIESDSTIILEVGE